MAMVVFVFASILMLAEGLERTLVETGSWDNALFLRKGSTSEVLSFVTRDHASILETSPEVALDEDGRRLLAKELVVLVNVPKKGSVSPANVIFRGVEDASFALRPQVQLVSGRLPRMGTPEVMVGESLMRNFEGIALNGILPCGQREWRIVGIFSAGSTGFSSEIWGDADQLMQAFRRPAYSIVLFRLRDSSAFPDLKSRTEGDPRLTVQAKRESRFYEEQSELMAKFLRIMGASLTILFSLGAIIGAMITMYSAVASRVTEIGTLRALGFRRRDILTAFLLEALLLGFGGGAAGLFFASFMQFISLSTTNWQSFAELAFGFTLSGDIIAKAMAFALVMGLAGGLLPAFRASRMPIVDALRAV
jgi:ABC-type lipoprotein release transport system permease subunit